MYFEEEKYDSFGQVKKNAFARKLSRWLLIFFIGVMIFMFVPWTQNVQSTGYVTTLDPGQRLQDIYSTISGKIEKWYVIEGQHVHKGDTIVRLSEVKTDYFDPSLVERTKAQLNSKRSAADAYKAKIKALNMQEVALENGMKQKLSQTRNKIKQAQNKLHSDSADYESAYIAFQVAEAQFQRADTLFKRQIISLTKFEQKRTKYQEANAKRVSAQNKLTISLQEVINYEIELEAIRANYLEKISKNQSDIASTESNYFTAQSDLAKMENILANYDIRSGMYYVTASQNGYITRAMKKGIGEIVKESSPICSIMPANVNLAAELYVKPVDLPLILEGERLRLIFDGWPAMVFSGWPNASFGTFGGEVVAIDKVISSNGKYRVLVIPDVTDEATWPEPIRVGSGVQGLFLLNDVPIWYELWRQINGFPPDFYDESHSDNKLDKTIDKKYHTK